MVARLGQAGRWVLALLYLAIRFLFQLLERMIGRIWRGLGFVGFWACRIMATYTID
jgi:hypothetical protein